MDLQTLAIITAALLLFFLVSGRLGGTIITAPLIFIVFGLVVGTGVTGVAQIDPGHGMIHFIAECTLILVLFTDAAPLAKAYARLAAGMGECEENMPAVEIPLREGQIDKP